MNGGSCTKTNISTCGDYLTDIPVGLTDISIKLIGIPTELADMPVEVI